MNQIVESMFCVGCLLALMVLFYAGVVVYGEFTAILLGGFVLFFPVLDSMRNP